MLAGCAMALICGPATAGPGTLLRSTKAANQRWLDGFRTNPGEALERSMAGFPDAPDLSTAEPLGNTLLIKDYANLWRQPAVGNIAFVGDALMSIDPLWGVGCGFAFQTAEWLLGTGSPAILLVRPIAPPLH